MVQQATAGANAPRADQELHKATTATQLDSVLRTGLAKFGREHRSTMEKLGAEKQELLISEEKLGSGPTAESAKSLLGGLHTALGIPQNKPLTVSIGSDARHMILGVVDSKEKMNLVQFGLEHRDKDYTAESLKNVQYIAFPSELKKAGSRLISDKVKIPDGLLDSRGFSPAPEPALTPSLPPRAAETAAGLDSLLRTSLAKFGREHRGTMEKLGGEERELFIPEEKVAKSPELLKPLFTSLHQALGIPERASLTVTIGSDGRHMIVGVTDSAEKTNLVQFGLSNRDKEYTAESLQNVQYLAFPSELKKAGSRLISEKASIPAGMIDSRGFNPF